MIDAKIITFIKLCELNNFTLTAKALNLTQPAVSAHIKSLESELNTKLFIRNNNDLILTRSGEILLKYSKRILSLYDTLKTRLEDEKKHTKTLTIGISHTSESNVIAEVLAVYCSKNKGTKIKIISDSIKNLYDKLSSYSLDLAIVEGQIPSNKFSSILLDTDSLVVVLAKDHPLAKKSILNINELKNENLILRSTQSQTRSLLQSALESINLSINDFNIILELDNIGTIKDLVLKNRGISILPKSVCYHEYKNNTLAIKPIASLNMIRPINMVFLNDFVNHSFLEDILAIYNEIVK